MSEISTSGARLYPIGEVARLTGVPVKTIRYYADIDLLPPAHTTESRYRMFSAGEIWRLEVIRTLRSFEFGIEDIRRLLSGDLSIGQAIDVQLAAVDQQIDRLTRVQQILALARQSADRADDSLQHLHELGTALSEGVTKRRELLAAKLRGILSDLSADAPPQENHFLQSLVQCLPEAMSAEQAAAWGELVALVNEPRFATALQGQLAPFVATGGQARDDLWQRDRHSGVVQRALAAREAGAPPDSAEVQTIVDEWLGLFAVALDRRNDAAFARWFADEAPRLMPAEIEQFWALFNRVMGQATVMPEFDAQRLLLAGLRWRATQRSG